MKDAVGDKGLQKIVPSVKSGGVGLSPAMGTIFTAKKIQVGAKKLAEQKTEEKINQFLDERVKKLFRY